MAGVNSSSKTLAATLSQKLLLLLPQQCRKSSQHCFNPSQKSSWRYHRFLHRKTYTAAKIRSPFSTPFFDQHSSHHQSLPIISSTAARCYSTMADTSDYVVIPKNEVKRYMVDCLGAVGVNAVHASQMADVLIAGDYRGHYSHGLNRLDMYVHDVQRNLVAKEGEPVLEAERGATGQVDGRNLLGPVVGNFAMKVAIQKAKEQGIGWVVARNSNHYGIAGYYTLEMMKEGLIGMSMTNTSPIIYPPRSSQPALGTNPISVAAPGTNGDSYVLDMATSTVAIGKVELSDRKGQQIPHGWGVDKTGKETTNPKDVTPGGGGLFPLGGPEITGGYKGYGLAMMVEVLCGVLAGATSGPNVRRWMDSSRQADLGQCFVAIDPTAFAPGFEGRMQQLINECRGLKPIEESDKVLVAGDPERDHMAECDGKKGIPYHPNQIAHAIKLAEELSVEPMKPL